MNASGLIKKAFGKFSNEKFLYRRTATTYTDYAKDLCTYYAIDLRTYELCQKTKKLVGVRNKDDYLALKEDLLFINSCLKSFAI